MRVFDRGRFADSAKNSGASDFGGNRMALSVESAAEIAVFFIAIDVIRLNLRGISMGSRMS